MLTRCFALVIVAAVVGGRAAAQPAAAPASALRIDLGFGVDTVTAPRHQIFALWRAYLSDRPDSAHPNRSWAPSEQRRWPAVDLTAPAVFQYPEWAADSKVTLVELDRATPNDSTMYVLRTLYARVPDSTDASIQPRVLQRVYAVRESGRWVLANALPRLTADWPRTTVGPITFIYWPEHRFDRVRAERSARFVDSLARAFGVTLARPIMYVMAPSPDELARITGLDFALPFSGRTYPEDALVTSGLPTAGEWYPHELAHLVFRSLQPTAPSRFLSEGAATWVGGSRGRDYPALVRELRDVLRVRPSLTLDSIVAPHGWVDSVSYTAGAVLFQIAYDHGGNAAVRALLATPAGPDDRIFDALARYTGLRRAELNTEWRHRVEDCCATTGAS